MKRALIVFVGLVVAAACGKDASTAPVRDYGKPCRFTTDTTFAPDGHVVAIVSAKICANA